MKLGVIADDFTGATDIAGFLVENGVKVIQLIGVPHEEISLEAEAYVISLKSRSCPSEEAVALSLAALEKLRAAGCDTIYFKYCSTFDSSEKGNIGPVTDALLDAMNQQITIVCPALPVNGRTVYMGYLFVGDMLLNESGMKDHPVTPMRDARLRRILESQAQGKATEIHAPVIDEGSAGVRDTIAEAEKAGFRYVVVDTLSNEHLRTIAEAVSNLPLLTGGSGLAAGIAQTMVRTSGDIGSAQLEGRPPRQAAVILSGSSSVMSNRQVAAYKSQAASLAVEVDRCLNDDTYLDELFDWAVKHVNEKNAPLIYATASPERLTQIREQYGEFDIGSAIETLFGNLALRLYEWGVRNFIVAGGETSGTVVQSLKTSALRIGPQIAPGVPWVKAVGKKLYLALKSGNFGDEEFFLKAQEMYRD